MARVYYHKGEESDRINEWVVELANQGLTVRQIAAKTSLPHTVVRGRVQKMFAAGRIPPAAVRKGTIQKKQTTIRSEFRTAGVTYGRMADVVENLTPAEVRWLVSETPRGSTLADLLTAMVRDAYAERDEK